MKITGSYVISVNSYLYSYGYCKAQHSIMRTGVRTPAEASMSTSYRFWYRLGFWLVLMLGLGLLNRVPPAKYRTCQTRSGP